MYTIAIASIYDKLATFDYTAWSAWYKAVFERGSIQPGAHVLDAGCGTGKLTIELAKLGYHVTGMDTSQDMLNIALGNLRLEGLKLPLVHMDMREMALHKKADAIVSACDGVNYLTEKEDVMRFFQSAYMNLAKGGVLAFDISSLYKLSLQLGENVFTHTDDDICYIWDNSYYEQEKLCVMEITYFLKEKELYRRHFERHVQRAHAEKEITKWLREAGFRSITVYDGYSFSQPNAKSERLNFTAVKE